MHDIKKWSSTKMSSSSTVTIRKYSDANVLVQGDYDTYAKDMKRYKARWNARLKGGQQGWLVPLEFESAVRAHFKVPAEKEDKYRPAASSKKPVSKTVEASTASSRKKSNDSSHRKRRSSDEEEEDEEEEVVDEEEVEEEEDEEEEVVASPPRKNHHQSRVTTPPAKSKKSSTSSASEDFDENEQDVVSLAKHMRSVIGRLEKVERSRK
jgi:hypothetical protein